MSSATHTEVAACRNGVAGWMRNDYTFVRFAGKDAAEWLHSQSTNDVTGLDSGQGHANAVLDRQGRLQGNFTLHRWDDEFWMLIEKSQLDHTLKHLEDHLFIEEVEVEPSGDALEQLILQGPKTLPLLSAAMDTSDSANSSLLPRAEFGVHPIELYGFEVLAFRISMTGEDGYVIVGEQGECQAIRDQIFAMKTNFPLAIASDEAQEGLRIEAGVPKFGVDMNTTHLLPETTLERNSVSYEKGCYLGQEVVARLKAYGSVKRALMGLRLPNEAKDHLSSLAGVSIKIDSKSIGTITSATYSPTLAAPIALAYLDRDHRTPETTLSLEIDGIDAPLDAIVSVLPLVTAPTRRERAEALYANALDLFQADFDDSDESAIPLLKEAVLLEPEYEDAYEVLGVILNRHHRVDEAIYYMKHLKSLNPNSIMAHTNLSVFYLAKGMIDEAEEEKAMSAVLQIQRASDDRKAQEMAQEERGRIQQEAQDRIAMFEEVLEIDPDDPVATFGLGKAYMQLNRYEDAIPHLQHATEVQKDYSAAYLDLGKCFEFLERPGDATDTFQAGIAVAARKGDLMPMREMERRLKALEENLNV